MKELLFDREYLGQLLRVAGPIALQNLLMSSINLINVLMIGQLGEASVAGIGLSGQVFFLLNLVLFGIMSGSAMFTAQLWGKRDVPNIRRMLGLALALGLFGALIFGALAVFIPEIALRFYTEDAEVIRIGAEYLSIFGWSYPFFAITFAYVVNLRSTGNVRLPLFVSIGALGFGTLLSYGLIFGAFGLPELGVNGAGWANLVARVLECVVLLFFIYRDPTSPAAASFRELFSFDFTFIMRVMKPVLPVIANEVLWSFGITTYNAIYARVGTDAYAAINIVGSIDQMAFVLFIGIGNATSILVGNLIGRGDPDKAYAFARRSLVIQILGAMLIGVVVYFSADLVFGLYKVSAEVIANARNVLLVMASAVWLRAGNMVIIVGILRAGGDTKFSLILDGIVIWAVGVPLAAIGAFVLHFPIHLVYALSLTEELTKFLFGVWRFRSRKWINDLTSAVAGEKNKSDEFVVNSLTNESAG